LDNSTTTCGDESDFTITCSDNGAANTEANLIGNYMMDPRNPSYQVPVANADASFVIDLNGHGSITNATCAGAASASNVGSSYTCDFSDNNGQLSYFGFNGEISLGLTNYVGPDLG
jgi:hypothetical protein